MSVLDKVADYFTGEASRNRNTSIIAGLLFFAGWWVLIDAMSIDLKHQITTGHVFIGIFGTISFCMVNAVKGEHVRNSNHLSLGLTSDSLLLFCAQISEENSSESGARIAKIWLLVGFLMGFASIIAAIWVMIDDFINNEKKEGWFGVALLMQNVFILFASLIYKFGRNEEEWNE
ncbi:transmembrane protein 50A isoform X1 [Drosophila santomea]|uniref:transmembrane protein 50A isoform X1 n=1 Tax=Drosophila santomea TaxID=129105 RepID=UPI0019549B8E|nr:transmembrane protein 50A isoform X1 [Drosophila santomea]